LQPANLRSRWKIGLGGKLTSPVIGGGRLLVADVNRHTVHTLDADSGERIWNFTAGGRVDSPSTIAGNLAVFGCADGYVYCTVGRSSFLDGGMYLHRLDLSTGRLLGATRFDDRDPETLMQREETIGDVELPGALPDVLVDDGQYIYVRDKVLDRDGIEQDRHLPHLYCSAGLLDDSWWHRTAWLWGERNWGRASGWAVMPGIRPSGRILVLDETTIFGYGRRNVKGNDLRGYHLFRADKEVEQIDSVIKNNNAALTRQQKPAKVIYHWSRQVPLLVRAIALAGEIIFAAGQQTSSRNTLG